jgi:SAM-dependent methyltransferase
MPPAHLRVYYYGTTEPTVFTRRCDDARAELLARGLQPAHRVLDIGAGIGNLAIGLIGFLRGSYDGVEIHPEAVAWCQRAITSRHPAFRFHRADVRSDAYHAGGRASAAHYQFPFADGSFDVVFLGSVFTHMLPDDVAHYLNEIGRVLAPGGWCVASFFLLNDATREGVERGRSFMSFGLRDRSGHARLHDAAIAEAAIALEESFVLECCRQSRLAVKDVRRGGWATGSTNDQDVVTFLRQ